VRGNCSEEEFHDFKNNKIFGIEQQAKIAALAVVNMILCGDDGNHIINVDCLRQHLTEIKAGQSFAVEYGYKTCLL